MLALLIGFSSLSLAQAHATSEDRDSVSDLGELYTRSQEARLEEKIEKIKKDSGLDILLETVTLLEEGENLDSIAQARAEVAGTFAPQNPKRLYMLVVRAHEESPAPNSEYAYGEAGRYIILLGHPLVVKAFEKSSKHLPLSSKAEGQLEGSKYFKASMIVAEEAASVYSGKADEKAKSKADEADEIIVFVLAFVGLATAAIMILTEP